LLQVARGFPRPVDDAPEIDLEQLAHVFDGDAVDAPIHAGAGVVDPGVEAAECLLRRRGDGGAVRLLGHVGDNRNRLAAGDGDLLHELAKRRLAAGGEHQARALRCSATRGGQADARCRAGDDDDLVGQWLQCDFHLLPFKATLSTSISPAID